MSESATVRSVKVRLEAEIAKYVTDIRTAGRETDKAFSGVNDRLATTDDRLGKVSTGLDSVATKERRVTSETDRMASSQRNAARDIDTGGKSIDKYSGRLGLLVSGLSAIGPAVVPITAVALPAITALGSGLGFAAAGFGAVKLASLGVKDALTKLNNAELEPTATNLAAADLALSQLPPDVRSFVVELQRLRPELTQLQNAAASGLFPGVDAGLRAAQADIPLVERGIGNISTKLGSLARQAGQSLGSSEWRPFLRFVGTEAPHELGVLGHATGDVTHGLAELWMAFSPLNRDVDSGVLRLAQDFDRWATSLDKTRDYQSFLLYVRTNGPRVVELLGDTAQLFVDIVQAAAPLGGPTLQALDLIVKVLDAIANSPVATPLLALGQIAAILKLTSRGLAGLGVDAKIGFGGIEAGAKGSTTQVRGLRAELAAAGRAAKTIGGNARRYTSSGTLLTTGVTSEEKTGLAKTAALGGGLALAASGIDQKIGLTNTATLALAGSMAGPLGTAIGGAVGGFLDLQNELDAEKLSMQVFGNQIDELVSQKKLSKLEQLSNKLHTARDATGDGIAGGLLDQMLGQVDPAVAKTKARLDKLSGTQRLAAASAGDFGHAEQVAARRTLTMRTAADETSQKFLAFGDNLDNTKVSLDHWIGSLARQAQALEQFGQNAATAADKGLRSGLIKALDKAGPAGALRMRQLANATQSEIAKANRAWGSGKKAADDYRQTVAYINQHPAQVYVKGVPQSLQALRQVASELRSLRDKTVTVTTKRVVGGSVKAGLADGGQVPGPRQPYGDKVLIAAAPGEHIITNRHGEADRFRADVATGRIPAYAGGGAVSTSGSRGPSTGLYKNDPRLAGELTGVRGHLHQLSTSLAAATKELDKERQTRQNLVANEKQLAASVTTALRSDIFTAQGSVWQAGGGADPHGILRSDIRRDRQFGDLLRGLHKRGVGGQILAQLAQSGSVDEAQAVAGMGGKELRSFVHDFGVRQRLTSQIGRFTGDSVFGQRIAEQTQVVRGQAADVHQLRREQHAANQRLAAIEKAVKQNAKDTAKELDKGGRRAARKVAR